jgi:GNAT superfamily N-acetyltransferase
MSESPLTIRQATVDDVDTLAGLISALAEYESLPGPDADARRRLAEHGFGDRPKFEAWLAELGDGGGAVGYALIFETYSTFLARPSLYLEDLFVLPDDRRRGYGKQLLGHCIRLAIERGCGRMEWACLDWNTRAQSVYESLGARHLEEWMPYRLTADQMSTALELVDRSGG